MYVFASMYNRDKDFWYDKLIEDIKRKMKARGGELKPEDLLS